MSDIWRNAPQLRNSHQQLREEFFASRLEALEKELAVYKEKERKALLHDNQSSSNDGTPDPLWDDVDGIHRCHDCRFEVSDGLCQGCGKEYTFTGLSVTDSISTNNEALNLDRTSHTRSTTPRLDVGPHLLPPMYVDRADEYEELLARGATRLMCETFELQFTPAVGIVAWADQDLFDEFTGEGMKRGDRWKIRLGRRIQLYEEDLDGSQFIEDFLEDAMLFPLQFPLSNRVAERWETAEVTPGIWETRLMLDVDDQRVLAGDDGDIEYDGDDDSEMDDDLYDPKKFPGLVDNGEAHMRAMLKEDVLLGPRDEVNIEALGVVLEPDNVVVQAGYESTGSDAHVELEHDESDAMFVDANDVNADPGWEISADVPDADWPESEDEDEATESKTLSPNNTVNVEIDVCEDKYVDDSADSDFDSDEELSGDEIVGFGANQVAR